MIFASDGMVSLYLCDHFVLFDTPPPSSYQHLAASEMWCCGLEEGEYATVLCTVIKCKMVWAVTTGRSTVSGFDLACFSSLSSKRLSVFGFHAAV